MKSWKTTAFGIASVASFVAGFFLPQYKDFCRGLMEVLLAVGFIAAKDYDVTGGTR